MCDMNTTLDEPTPELQYGVRSTSTHEGATGGGITWHEDELEALFMQEMLVAMGKDLQLSWTIDIVTRPLADGGPELESF
jgi:hypothetical protein